jgi:hypothetical protein
MGLLPDKAGVIASFSLNDLAIELHSPLPGQARTRYRGTDRGNTSLEVLRMLSARRATCKFDEATKHYEDKNKEDEQPLHVDYRES